MDSQIEAYTNAEYRVLTHAYRFADRTTAYWKKDKYDEGECQRAWAYWFSVIDSIGGTDESQ